MNREIKYSGLSYVPSDYESPDGQLALSLNLIPEDEALFPLNEPLLLSKIPDGFIPVAIHKVMGRDNIFLWDSKFGLLHYADLNRLSDGTVSFAYIQSKPVAAILGNVVIFSSSQSSIFCLWKPDKSEYHSLGNGIPEFDINFALGYALQSGSSHSSSLSVPIPDGISGPLAVSLIGQYQPGRELNPPRSSSDSFISAVSNAVMGFVNKFVADAHADSKFVFPFFIRWALRLFDGSYVHQSAPILMLPNSFAPVVGYSGVSEKDGLISMNVSIPMRSCSLLMRIPSPHAIAEWKDVVSSVDIFVSAPIFTYDQSGDVSPLHRDSIFRFSHSGNHQRVDPVDVGSSEDGHRHPASLADPRSPHFCFPDGNAESVLSFSGSALNPAARSQKEIEDLISSVSAFYLISSIPISDFPSSDNAADFLLVDIADADLSNIVARPQLPDDWRSHDSFSFSHAFSYNSRIVLSGIASEVFPGFSIQAMSQFFLSPSQTPDSPCDVWVKTLRESRSIWVKSASSLPGGWIPRWLFYPDSNASEMRVILSDGSGWSIPLKAHDFLNGAYWFDGLGSSRAAKADAVDVPVKSTSPVSEPSKVFVSEVGNPFLIPLAGRVSVGSGSVFATSAAVKALSQGQFGQFPLYAFSSEGVWALSVSASGTIAAVQPVSRDVCSNPGSITQIDSAVLFASDRGIMLIAGSQTQCISDTLHSISPFLPLSLPGMDAFRELLAVGDDACLDIKPFSEFLSDCGMVYDYVHQRIYVFSHRLSYAYVYSLSSKMWGMVRSKISHSINSYPEALAVDSGGNLVNFSNVRNIFDEGSELQSGNQQLLISRPLKLGAPNVLKSVQEVIQRGLFRKGHVRCALYGSRDLLSWHLVRSSQSHILRAFSGSPYRYFRIALLCSLAPDESISGCALSFSPRFNNRLR